MHIRTCGKDEFIVYCNVKSVASWHMLTCREVIPENLLQYVVKIYKGFDDACYLPQPFRRAESSWRRKPSVHNDDYEGKDNLHGIFRRFTAVRTVLPDSARTREGCNHCTKKFCKYISSN